MVSSIEIGDILIKNDNFINACIYKKYDTGNKVMSFDDVKSEYLLILHKEFDKIYNIKKLNIKATTIIYNNIIVFNRIDRIKNKEFKHLNYIEIDELDEI